MDTPYARAHDPWIAELAGMDVGELRVVVRQLRKATHRVTWRRKLSTKASELAAVLRGLPLVIGDQYAGRAKRGDRWELLVRDEGAVVVAVEVRATKPASWESVELPLTVRVARPDLVDPKEIERWQERVNERRQRRRQSA